ncbi:hypothetical protein O3P69_001602 [Scylla paramamosain]|uniref:Uncharacterized protein n=1 Tax=Scylla paramamosain TaxID=85552 RepID=A0AAW0V1D9_SCYPA
MTDGSLRPLLPPASPGREKRNDIMASLGGITERMKAAVHGAVTFLLTAEINEEFETRCSRPCSPVWVSRAGGDAWRASRPVDIGIMWEKEKTHMQPQSQPASKLPVHPHIQQANQPASQPPSQPSSKPASQPSTLPSLQPRRDSHTHFMIPAAGFSWRPVLAPMHASTQQLTTAPTRPSPITRRRHPGNDRPPLEAGIEHRGDPGQSRSGRGCPSTGYEGDEVTYSAATPQRHNERRTTPA